MSTVNNIALLKGHTDEYRSDKWISQRSLEHMLARDCMDNTSEDVQKYIKLFITQLELNREG